MHFKLRKVSGVFFLFDERAPRDNLAQKLSIGGVHDSAILGTQTLWITKYSQKSSLPLIKPHKL